MRTYWWQRINLWTTGGYQVYAEYEVCSDLVAGKQFYTGKHRIGYA